jgi:hypothetical protein
MVEALPEPSADVSATANEVTLWLPGSSRRAAATLGRVTRDRARMGVLRSARVVVTEAAPAAAGHRLADGPGAARFVYDRGRI